MRKYSEEFIDKYLSEWWTLLGLTGDPELNQKGLQEAFQKFDLKAKRSKINRFYRYLRKEVSPLCSVLFLIRESLSLYPYSLYLSKDQWDNFRYTSITTDNKKARDTYYFLQSHTSKDFLSPSLPMDVEIFFLVMFESYEDRECSSKAISEIVSSEVKSDMSYNVLDTLMKSERVNRIMSHYPDPFLDKEYAEFMK